MLFDLNETQAILNETALRLIREKYSFEQRKQIIASPRRWSQELWSELAELGILGVEIAEEYGGSGGSFADAAVVIEAFGRGLCLEPILPTVVIGAGIISAAGSSAQKGKLLPRIAAGDLIIALAHYEPACRFSHAISTSAEAREDGFVINGSKAVVLGGGDAELLIVSARTFDDPTCPAGASLFLIDPLSEGVEIRAYRNVDDRGAAEVKLENVFVSQDAVLGPLGGAIPLVDTALDRGNAGIICEAVGAMDAVNELTLDYIKNRAQFGRAIGKFQALQHRMADMFMSAELARSMKALTLASVDLIDPHARAQAISCAKLQIIQSAQAVGRGAIQLHGGIGMTLEHAAGHYLRRLTAVEKLFGDQDWHLTRFSAT